MRDLSILLLSFLLIIGLFSAISASADAPQNQPINQDTSANWAGYVASADTYTGVGGTWVVPNSQGLKNVDSSNNQAADAVWVGIGGTNSRDLIQAGTQSIIDNGEMTYQVWYEVLPQSQKIIPLTISAGNSISVSLTELTSNQWQLSIKDNSTGQSYEKTIDYQSSESSADWIVERPLGIISRQIQGFIPLDNFGSVNFTNAYAIVNGKQLNLNQSGATAVQMASSGNILATASIIGTSGDNFSVSRQDTTSFTSDTLAAIDDTSPQIIIVRFRHHFSRGFFRL